MGNLFEQFRRTAQEHPDAAAIDESNGVTSYGRLLSEVDRLRRRLLVPADVGRDPVAVLTSHSGAAIRALLGVWAAGRTAVPLDASLPADTLRERLRHATCRTVVCDQAHCKLAETIAGHNAEIIAVSENADDDLSDVARREPRPPDAQMSPPEESDAAVIVYTSGSTGRPRGVVHTHESLAANAANHIQSLNIGRADRGLWLAKASTISGLTDSLRILLAGGILLPCDLTTAGLTGLIKRLQSACPTIVHFVPTIFRRLCTQLDDSQRARVFRSVRVLHLGGETVTRRDFELFRKFCADDCLLLHNLGCTEAPSFRQSLFRKSSQITEPTAPLECDAPGTSVHLIDETTGKPIIKSGHNGEIVVSGRRIAAGYWRDDECTARSFDRRQDGAVEYRTGDVGSWTSSGALVHLGRIDQQVKVLGRRIDLAPLEAELAQHPQIDEAAVLAIPTSQSIRLVACYVSSAGLQEEQLRAMRFQSCGSLPDLDLVALPEFPTLPNGKLDRRRLRQIVEGSSRGRDRAQSATLTPTEQTLAGIWRQVLQIEQVSPHDDFFRLGGDSLSAADLLIRVDRTFHRRLQVSELIANPTLRQLADRLEVQGRSSARRRCLTVIHQGTAPILAVGGFDVATPLRKRFIDGQSVAGDLDNVVSAAGLAVLTRPGARQLRFRYPSIDRSVELYRAELAEAGITSPSAIVGFSYGGLLAYELACRLWEEGARPRIVMLIEPTLPYRDRPAADGVPEPQSASDPDNPKPGPISQTGVGTATMVDVAPVTDVRRFKNSLLGWTRRSGWVESAHYSRLLFKRLLARPLTAKEEWDLFRPILRRNLRTYATPTYPGDVLVVGSADYLSRQQASWQRLVAGSVQTVSLGKDAGHFGFKRRESEEVWIAALL